MKDKTVIVLESRAGQQLIESLTRRGARAVWAPALAEQPDADPEEIRRLIADWEALAPALVIFQTGVGTAALFKATDALGLTPRLLELLGGVRVAVRGPKPAAELNRRRVHVDFAASSPFTTREILFAVRDVPLSGHEVFVQRYGQSNQELLQALRGRGAIPREIATYRWTLPADLAPLRAAIELLIAGKADAVAFTSASQVRHLLQVAAEQGRSSNAVAALNAAFVASIGPVCSAALRDAGITPSVEASPPKLGPLVAALEAGLAAPN